MTKLHGHSKYTPEIAARVLAELETGKTLRAVCTLKGLPDERSVRRWVSDDVEGFAPQYLRAREIGYMAMADEIIAISDDGLNDTYRDDEGNIKTDWDVLGRSKLRADNRKWLLSKALPKIYGDKMTNEHTGPNGEPLNLGEDARARKLRALLTMFQSRIAQNNTDDDDFADLA